MYPLIKVGSGYTVEGQKTGEEKFGGLQIEIIPSYEKSLRTWLPEPMGRGAANDKFDWPRVLDEQKTPSELGLNPGNKIRSYPSSPVYYAPYAIADLVRNAPKEDTRIQVRKMWHKESCIANFNAGPISTKWGSANEENFQRLVSPKSSNLSVFDSIHSLPATKFNNFPCRQTYCSLGGRRPFQR